MIEKFLETVMTEYGVFVFFLMLTIGCLLGTIKILWTRNADISDRFFVALENNTKILTQLAERID